MSLFGCKNCGQCTMGCNCSNQDALPVIILVGNPNVGKSVIFNALSGFYVEVSNYPGTTVDVSRAYTEYGELIDTPGAYSLGSYTDDEIVTQNIIQKADIVINVVSALSLERDLLLTQQLIDLGLPVILVVNQYDEALKRGIVIDFQKLEELTDLTVIKAAATKGQGVSQILNEIKKQKLKISQRVTPFVKAHMSTLPECERFKKLLQIESQNTKYEKEKDEISSYRREIINVIHKSVVSFSDKKNDITDYLEVLLYNPFVNAILCMAVLAILFEIIGVFISGNIVDFAYGNLNKSYYPFVTSLVDETIPLEILRDILAGEFGIFTMAVGIIFGILLPLLTAFYFFMALLEDSGYLPRLAAFADNFLNKIGLNGRAVIPLLLGFGCGTMGTLTTRILGSKKERTIATALIGITIPCAAQQGIIIALLASIGGLKVWLLYLGVIFFIMATAGTILDRLLPGTSTNLLINLPPLRVPSIFNLMQKTFTRIVNFLKEAAYLFAIGSVIITILNRAGFLKVLQKSLEPVVVNLLHLPAQFSDVFVMGLIRRDFASVGLYEMAGIQGAGGEGLSSLQILTAAIVITLFVPCFASLVVIYKERGVKEATMLWLSTFVISILTGALVTRIFGFLF